MTKRTLRTLLCCAMAPLCLGGCLAAGGCVAETTGTSFNDQTATFENEGEETFAPADISEASSKMGEPLVLEEMGWNAKDSYVHYGIMVSNPNSDLIARNTTVRIALYDKQGELMVEDESTIRFVGPGETVGYAGNKVGDGYKPASVEISLETGSTIWQDAEGYTAPFTIESVEETDALYRRYQINGEVANHTGAYAGTVPLSFICRKKDGSICGGYVGEAYRIKEGRTKSFKVTLNTVPDHATLEVYPSIYVEGETESASNSPYY